MFDNCGLRTIESSSKLGLFLSRSEIPATDLAIALLNGLGAGLLYLLLFTFGHLGQASELQMRLTPTQESFIQGEPVFVRLTLENQGTNEAIVVFGDRMIANIFMWTDTDKVLRKSARLKQGGGTLMHAAISVEPGKRFEEMLVVDDWLFLPQGKPILNVGIKWDKGENPFYKPDDIKRAVFPPISSMPGPHGASPALKWDKGHISSSVAIEIRPDQDGALDAALKSLVRRDPRTTDFEAINQINHIRRGLKAACHRPTVKAALLRLREAMREEPGLEIVKDVLNNYDRSIVD